MNRKTLKSILNVAAKELGRAAAKQFNNRKDYVRVEGAWIHLPTSSLFLA